MPPGDGWLGAREREVVAGLTVAPRRASWRLGRWTAKCAASAYLRVPLHGMEILAAPDGAPEVWLDGARAPLSLSLSHRAGRGLAVVGPADCAVGCDLEAIEPRSDAFIREWLSAPERAYVAAGDRAQRANLVWTGKEAAAKVRREGLRLDVRRMVASPRRGTQEWAPLEIASDGEGALHGWWHREPGWVIAVVSDPTSDPPRRLEP